MGKENDSGSPKKRRKSISSTSSTTPGKDNDMYKTIITFEEQEAISRSPERDSEKFFSTCDMIRNSMEKISKLKSTDDATNKDDIRELMIDTSLAFIELKKLNRMEKFRTKFARDSLTSAKMGVDSRHLQLQNLLYEVMHLKKEVIKCLQFKSKDESIQLVSEEEFYKEAPSTISRTEITKADPHQLRLARLEWELTQRKQLASLCDELSESKKAVASSISTKQSRLDNLAPQLRSILESSKPLQESLGLPLDKIHQEHQKASLLPTPLYVLYLKATAYRDAYDHQLMVSVEGDEDEAKRINSQEGSNDSDSDQGEEIPQEETPVHKKRHHRISKEARMEEKKSRVLQRHPLTVQLILTIKNQTKMSLKFLYMTLLKIVTVESYLTTDDTGPPAGDMLMSESVLKELYPKDFGIDSPNPANFYQLSRQNFGSFSSLGVGTPYKWAQRMAGLQFIRNDVGEKNKVDVKIAHDSVEEVLKEVKKRIKARLELCGEIRMLEAGNFPVFPGDMPMKLGTTLVKFGVLRRTEDLGYEAVLRRGSSELIAHINIKPDYPKISPVFNIRFNPSVPSSADIIRDMEREINVMWDKPTTLSAQVQRLRACFDIYLETEGMAPKEKVFFHPVKGRTRSRPYKYLSLAGGIFTQR
ncbi:THO complex subunit 5 homolog [Fopius arisanus]|uniref:THO complex subunit 5 homolog n=2 Tax=Fopius arisanus TaxID=64838 RepID=A0A0C9Q2T3_9HYME|nr:PREDICTED: THO complex subunit 5 homolog [Fopius arisanus]